MPNLSDKRSEAVSGIFVTDFDGTLLRDDKTIDPEDLHTLAGLRAGHTITAIATGRSQFSFHRALDDMGLSRADLPVDYLIFSTGAGIYSLNRQRTILSHALPKKDIREITAYFDKRGFDYMVHKAIPDTPRFLFKSHGKSNPDFDHRIQLYPSLGKPFERDSDLFEFGTEVLSIVPGGMAMEEVEALQRDLREFSVIQATSPLDHQSAWIEVFHKAVSKSRSVAWLAKRLGVSREKVVSVGNDYNDLDLLEWSGAGFLVENGPEDMKSRFGVVGSNNACGMSQAVRCAGLSFRRCLNV